MIPRIFHLPSKTGNAKNDLFFIPPESLTNDEAKRSIEIAILQAKAMSTIFFIEDGIIKRELEKVGFKSIKPTVLCCWDE